MPPRSKFVLIAPPSKCDVAESSAAARAPRGQYDFVNTVEAGQGLIRSPGHDARTISRPADRARILQGKMSKCLRLLVKDLVLPSQVDVIEDPNEEHEPEDFDETESFEEDETAVTPPPPRHRGARIFVRPQTPMAASTQALIDAFVAGSSLFPLPPTSPAYDQVPLGHRTTMIRVRDDIPEEDMPPRSKFVLIAPPSKCDVAESFAAARAPRGQYDFVDTVEAGQGLIRSPGHDARTISR
nr:hypothetical protein [Tanacetum cinerariifolium]